MSNLPSNEAELATYLAIFKSLADEGYIPPNFEDTNNPNEDRGTAVFWVSIISMALAFIVVQLRIFARLRYGGGMLRSDDWLIIIATVITLGFTVVNTAAVTLGGLGRHLYTLSASNCIIGLRLSYAHQIVYVWAILFTKLSILLFIRRICAANDAFTRRACSWFMAFHVAWAVASTFAMALECHPLNAGFDIWARLAAPKSCGNEAIYYTLTSVSVFSDFAVLLLPVKTVWELRLPLIKKLTVLALFGIGGLACVCAILRMVYLFKGIQGYDYSWNVTYIIMYGQLETCLAIVTTSMPALRIIYQNVCPAIRNSVLFQRKPLQTSSLVISKHDTNDGQSMLSEKSTSKPDVEQGEFSDIEQGRALGIQQDELARVHMEQNGSTVREHVPRGLADHLGQTETGKCP